jgi:hypothetical protein
MEEGTFLDKVEEVLDLDLNIIEKNVHKTLVGEEPYGLEIGDISIKQEWIDNLKVKDYYYLQSKTYISIRSIPYTTFSKQYLYHDKHRVEVTNCPIVFDKEKRNRGITLGYINDTHYLHLPDFIATNAINNGIDTLVVKKGVILEFNHDKVMIYSHTSPVNTPYYLFTEYFPYTDNADLLARIIGVFDVWKRGELNSITPGYSRSAKRHFMFPFISLIVYRNTRSTLYPSFINTITDTVIDSLDHEIVKILNEYNAQTLTKLNEMINTFNKNNEIIDHSLL